MVRELPPWKGANDDTPIPARVKVRTFERFGGACAVCTLSIVGKLLPAYDHVIPIIAGGSNSEDNLQLLCVPCHLLKTKADVKEKSLVYRKKAKNIGLKLTKSRPMAGSKASGWKRKMDGTVTRR